VLNKKGHHELGSSISTGRHRLLDWRDNHYFQSDTVPIDDSASCEFTVGASQLSGANCTSRSVDPALLISGRRIEWRSDVGLSYAFGRAPPSLDAAINDWQEHKYKKKREEKPGISIHVSLRQIPYEERRQENNHSRDAAFQIKGVVPNKLVDGPAVP
jgi:hypothetical protein